MEGHIDNVRQFEDRRVTAVMSPRVKGAGLCQRETGRPAVKAVI